MKILLYNSEYKDQWDDLVRNSRNGTFLHQRDFIEYHRGRFRELSFMIYDDKDRLLAVMAGHIENKSYYSHQGLTYGGLVLSNHIGAKCVLDIFEHLIFTFRQQGFTRFVYKAIPHIYHRQPSEEDLYALFRLKAFVCERNISSTIDLRNCRIEYSTQRKNSLDRARRKEITVQRSEDYASFWGILADNLFSKYKKSPVHTLPEIELLGRLFPDNINLYLACDKEGEIIGGTVLFITDQVVHVQYIAATVDGKKNGAIDQLINFILNSDIFSDKKYFDYGVSTECGGYYLNENLINQKEGFGARATLYDIYEIIL
ncbi:GNAT family N-acetyltransferase [Dysgonomonas massiliensis]|uniref:GNAT family N-acetyltransferase n=1 Tax=Dysgonomonas massiliensis TaxID=2040292 RepID=UPI000C760550|nr:GNAT family N-acetyltransferase [Dysgonomonas massiliensis]